jgi:MFS family permease
VLNAPIRLSRNRNYTILWTGQLLSELAAEIAAVAFPLLVLSRSGSPLEVGLAASAMSVAGMVTVVPAGVMADRWNRRRTMLIAQTARVAGMASLVAALAFDWYSFTHVVLIMVLEGVLGSLFDPVEQAALPQVVPKEQLSTAVARNTARPFVASLIGPALAGVLFALEPAAPFVADLIILATSAIALVFLRLPPRPAATSGNGRSRAAGARAGWGRTFRRDAAVGLRWAFGQRVIRTTLIWTMLTNLVFGALLVVVISASSLAGVGAAEIGLVMTCFGIGGLVGAASAARLHEALPAPVIVLGCSWIVTGAATAMAMVPLGLPLGLLLGLAAVAAPIANTTVLTYQLLLTPDGLRGRLSSVAGFCSGGAGAVGPAAGGALLAATGSAAASFLACAVALALVALGATLSPVLRRFPAAVELERENRAGGCQRNVGGPS